MCVYTYIYMAARRLSLDKILQQRSHLLKSQEQVYRQTVQTSCGKRSKRLVANASNFLWQTVQMSCGNPGLIRFSYREIIHSVRKRTCKKWMPVTNFLHGLGTHCSTKNDWMLLAFAAFCQHCAGAFQAVSMIRVWKSHRQACEDCSKGLEALVYRQTV